MRYQLGTDTWFHATEMGFRHQIEPTADITVKLDVLDEAKVTTVEHIGTSHTITVKDNAGTTLATLSSGDISMPVQNDSGSSVETAPI